MSFRVVPIRLVLVLLLAIPVILTSRCEGEDEGRPTIPSTEQTVKARALVRDLFRGDYDRAKSSSQKELLSKKLIEVAESTKDDDTSRYALYVEARELAIEAAAVKTALLAVDGLLQFEGTQEFTAKWRVLEALSTGTRSNTVLAQVAASAREMMDDAIAEGAFESAEKCGTLAAMIAGKGRDPILQKKLQRRTELVRELIAFEKRYLSSKETLTNDPANAEACRIVGRYQCLVLGEWSAGFITLAQSDGDYQSVSQREISGPSDAKSKVIVADEWYKLASSESELLKPQLLGRALHWYGEAVEELNGLEKIRVRKRMDEIATTSKSLEALLAVEPKSRNLGTAVEKPDTSKPSKEPSAPPRKAERTAALMFLKVTYGSGAQQIDLTERVKKAFQDGQLILVVSQVLSPDGKVFGNATLQYRLNGREIEDKVPFNGLIQFDVRSPEAITGEKTVPQELKIHEAYYGSGILGEKSLVNITENLKKHVQGNKLSMTAREAIQGVEDPCFGVSKLIFVRYSLGGKIQTAKFEEGQKIALGRP